MPIGNHETLVHRLAQILIRLNQGEKIDPVLISEEFGVNLRTIQRDLNERFSYLPMLRTNGKYHLDLAVLGKLTTKDIQRFAALAGIQGLFPSLGGDFIREIFDHRVQEALLVRGHNYESLTGHEKTFSLLETAIIENKAISIDYVVAPGIKHYPMVMAYKLINAKGIWYLAATDQGKLKTYALTKIRGVQLLDKHFQHDATIDKTITEQEGVWISEEPFEVVVQVSKDAAEFFKRRKLIANQIIEKELEDGGLLLSARIGHANQIIPVARYWIPHLRIISPSTLQKELNQSLLQYIASQSECHLNSTMGEKLC